MYFVILFNFLLVWGKIKTSLVWNCFWEYSSTCSSEWKAWGNMNFVTFLFYFLLLINHHDDPLFTSMCLTFYKQHSFPFWGWLFVVHFAIYNLIGPLQMDHFFTLNFSRSRIHLFRVPLENRSQKIVPTYFFIASYCFL